MSCLVGTVLLPLLGRVVFIKGMIGNRCPVSLSPLALVAHALPSGCPNPMPSVRALTSHNNLSHLALALAGSWPGVCYGQVLFCFLFVFFAWVLGDLFATQVQCKTNRAEIRTTFGSNPTTRSLLSLWLWLFYPKSLPEKHAIFLSHFPRIFHEFFRSKQKTMVKERSMRLPICTRRPKRSWRVIPSPNPELKALIVHQISDSSNSPHVTSRGHRRMRPLTSASVAPLNGLNGECEWCEWTTIGQSKL